MIKTAAALLRDFFKDISKYAAFFTLTVKHKTKNIFCAETLDF